MYEDEEYYEEEKKENRQESVSPYVAMPLEKDEIAEDTVIYHDGIIRPDHLVENIKTGSAIGGFLAGIVPAVVGGSLTYTVEKICCPASPTSCVPLGAGFFASAPANVGAISGAALGALCTPVTKFFGRPKILDEVAGIINRELDNVCAPDHQSMG